MIKTTACKISKENFTSDIKSLIISLDSKPNEEYLDRVMKLILKEANNENWSRETYIYTDNLLKRYLGGTYQNWSTETYPGENSSYCIAFIAIKEDVY